MLECPNCAWQGEDPDVAGQVPTPDGVYARIYECPSCPCRRLHYIGE